MLATIAIKSLGWLMHVRVNDKNKHDDHNAVSAYMSVLVQPKEGTIPTQWDGKWLPTDPHHDCNYSYYR